MTPAHFCTHFVLPLVKSSPYRNDPRIDEIRACFKPEAPEFRKGLIRLENFLVSLVDANNEKYAELVCRIWQATGRVLSVVINPQIDLKVVSKRCMSFELLSRFPVARLI